MVGVFFTDQPVTDYETAQRSDLDRFAAYYRGMIEQGVFLPPSQFEGLFLSTAHTEEDIEQTISRSEEHTSELQSRSHLVCRLPRENKKVGEGDRPSCRIN